MLRTQRNWKEVVATISETFKSTIPAISRWGPHASFQCWFWLLCVPVNIERGDRERGRECFLSGGSGHGMVLCNVVHTVCLTSKTISNHRARTLHKSPRHSQLWSNSTCRTHSLSLSLPPTMMLKVNGNRWFVFGYVSHSAGSDTIFLVISQRDRMGTG